MCSARSDAARQHAQKTIVDGLLVGSVYEWAALFKVAGDPQHP